MRAWTNYQEQAEDAAFYRHLDGECGDLDAGCKYCKDALDAMDLQERVTALETDVKKAGKLIGEIDALVKKLFG